MELNIDKENLEKAVSNLNENTETSGDSKEPRIEMSKEEETGFHKGALNTLVAERNELIKMAQTVESVMQAHLKRLKELGVKIESKEKLN